MTRGHEHTEYCIYSIRHMDTLERWHIEDGHGEFSINQRWKTGKQILDQAKASKRVAPILFAPAENTSFIAGWAKLGFLDVGMNKTTVLVEDFRLLKDRFRKTSLKKRDGVNLDGSFIRPYAICTTPKRLTTLKTYPDTFVRLGEEAEFLEGAATRVSVNRYERDPMARAECVRFHGLQCVICEMNFSEMYGDVAARVIHVHHLDPLREGRRRTDPARDLVPVCPNCHAVIHLKTPPFGVEAVRNMLRQRSPTGGG